jgi:hypothetical protein
MNDETKIDATQNVNGTRRIHQNEAPHKSLSIEQGEALESILTSHCVVLLLVQFYCLGHHT